MQNDTLHFTFHLTLGPPTLSSKIRSVQILVYMCYLGRIYITVWFMFGRWNGADLWSGPALVLCEAEQSQI